MFSKNRPSRIPLKWSLLTCGGMVGKKKQSIEKQTVVQQGGTPLLLFTLLHHLQRLCTNQWGNMDLEISKVSHSSSREPKIDSNRTFHIPNGYIQYIQSEIKYISFFFFSLHCKTLSCVHHITDYKRSHCQNTGVQLVRKIPTRTRFWIVLCKNPYK